MPSQDFLSMFSKGPATGGGNVRGGVKVPGGNVKVNANAFGKSKAQGKKPAGPVMSVRGKPKGKKAVARNPRPAVAFPGKKGKAKVGKPRKR